LKLTGEDVEGKYGVGLAELPLPVVLGERERFRPNF
jgi:hypothetical protein